jgi:hypothetical protein
MRRVTLTVFALVGVFIFASLFLFTFASPQWVEQSGKSFIEWKLQKNIDQKIESIQLPEKGRFESLLGKKAERLRAETEAKLATVRQQLKDDAPALIAAEIAKMRNLDCECRKKWQQRLEASMFAELVSLEAARLKLTAFTQAKYMDIVQQLTLDVRVFFGANTLVFIMFLLVSMQKPAAFQHLFLPASLMLLSTSICSYFYIFEQNWFYTIIYNDYTGFGFVAYLLIVFAFLCDIVFNRARVTTEILNLFYHAIGSVTVVSPC